jgi:hypothetical protein
MDEEIIEKTLDFEKPTSYTFSRHAIIRYQGKITKDAVIGVAIEQATSPNEPGSFESPILDLTVKYKLSKGWEHFMVSSYSGLVRYRYNAGGKTDILLSGLNVSGSLAIKKQNRFTYQIIYGPGLNRYRGGASTTLDHQGKIVSIDELAYTLTFEHP